MTQLHLPLDAPGSPAARVYALVALYCRVRGGVCRIDLRSQGYRLRMAPSTVLYYLRRLVRDGYIEDLTPQMHARPHAYRLTDKPLQPERMRS